VCCWFSWSSWHWAKTPLCCFLSTLKFVVMKFFNGPPLIHHEIAPWYFHLSPMCLPNQNPQTLRGVHSNPTSNMNLCLTIFTIRVPKRMVSCKKDRKGLFWIFITFTISWL
jgi:hypothetical protein